MHGFFLSFLFPLPIETPAFEKLFESFQFQLDSLKGCISMARLIPGSKLGVFQLGKFKSEGKFP